MSMLDLEAFKATPLRHDPCDFLVVPGFIKADALPTVNRDYPAIAEPGNFPPEDLMYGPHFAAMLEELAGPEVRQAFAEKFGMDLSGHPLQTTIRRYSKWSDGHTHNDSRTKRITVLIYFNEAWSHSGGKLRLLRSPKSLDDYAVEVEPAGGTLLAFRRNDRSYHGFKPCEAERRSLQMYWVEPKRQARQEKNRGSLRKRIKRLLKGR